MGQCESWSVAYRKRRAGTTLADNKKDVFHVIKNNYRYWKADPFLFDWRGQTYLFAEMFDRIKAKGVIGYCILSDEGASAWKVVLELPFHLSYPFIFSDGKDIYMMPESFRGNEIALYQAVDFPNRWEKKQVLANVSAVDSTMGIILGKKYLLTIQVENGEGQLVSYAVGDDFSLKEGRILKEKEDPNARPAGKFFEWNGKLIRPTQDCTESYGGALNLYVVEGLTEKAFAEKLFQKIHPDDVKTDWKKKAKGLHTYNISSEYEVIDLKEYKFGFLDKLIHLCRIIAKK